MGTNYTVEDRPCESCPYRKATPSGVWSEEEYAKLPSYDGDMGAQAMKGGVAVFHCHKCDGAPRLCRGWTDCHGGENLLAIRMGQAVKGSTFPEGAFEKSDCEVYGSGEEAAGAGTDEIDDPSPEALKLMEHLKSKHKNLR